MGLFDTLKRIPKILEANLNDLLDKAEDPEKMMNQLLVDYRRDLAEVKDSTQDVMATLEDAKSQLKEVDDKIALKLDRMKNAAAAVAQAEKEGNTSEVERHTKNLTTLTQQKQQLEQERTPLAQQVAIYEQNADELRKAYNKLVGDIENMEMRVRNAQAKQKMAKAVEAVNDTTAIDKATSTAQSLDKYEKQAEHAFNKAMAGKELNAQLNAEADLDAEYGSGASPSVNSEVEALLAAARGNN